uniref:Putative secreted protein n=1 Tax=Haematobia irritans TaxID=7368 RepID=A0A1L8EJ68_HAEIR
MKIYVTSLILLGIAVACQAQLLNQGLNNNNGNNNPVYTGQPGCQTEEELTVGVYAHFRMKNGYWRCTVLGQPATLEVCPVAQGFLEPARACVPWGLWYWTPTVAPPSFPVPSTVEVLP